MKLKQYIWTILGVCALGLTSCDLNIAPYSYIADEYYFENAAQVNTAVIGCYGGMQAPLRYEWALTELRSDNSRMYSSSTQNDANLLLLAFDNGTMNSANTHIRSYWESTYNNINSCNTILLPENLAVVEEEKLRAQYEGEVLFIRAYHYFNLVRLWGPVFLITDPLSVEESLKENRAPVEKVYEQIVKDLTRAVENLDGVEYGSVDLGRATVEAARGLLAKVYMTLGQFAEARPLLEAVIAEKGEDLIPYESIFDINNEMNEEILFAVRYKTGNYGIGSPFANMFAPNNSGICVVVGSGDGNNYPTDEIWNLYEPEDVRRDVTIADHYVDESKPNPVISDSYVKKFLSEVTVRYDAENDWPVLRYADVLLMYAEVMNELQGPAAGLHYLNLVRQRAGLRVLDSSEIGSRYVFRTALEKERRLELAFENHRWFDLLRWGKAKEVINDHIHRIEWAFYSTYDNEPPYLQDYQLILPIPQSVIDNNSYVVTQNPYY